MEGYVTFVSPLEGERYFQLPESAHDLLGQVRDELGILAQLALRTGAENQMLHLSAMGLSQWFARFSAELTSVMAQCHWPSAQAEAYSTLRH